MALEATITGRIAEPTMRFTQTGRPVLDLSIACTRSSKNRDTGEWADDGAPLWVSATFWDLEAERLYEHIHKGDKVTVAATIVREEFDRRDGTRGDKLVARFPRFLGTIPKADNQQQGQGQQHGSRPQQTQQAAWDQAAGGQQGDPWRTGQQTEFSTEPPF